MIDSVAVIYRPASRIDVSVFEAGEEVAAVGTAKHRRNRYWINGDLGVRCTYWCDADQRDAGLLKVEWSVPRVSLSAEYQDYNPGLHDVALSCVLIDLFLKQRVAVGLMSVRDWQVQRIDYSLNWRTSRVNDYLLVLSDLVYRSNKRRVYDGDGVMWHSSARSLKFYSRSDILRFEVSNYPSAVKRLVTWFGCARTVSKMAQPGRGLYVIGRMFDELGLQADVDWSGGPALRALRLRDCFGTRNVGIAEHVLHCLAVHGTASIGLGLVGRSTYYAWRKRLIQQGFVVGNERVYHTLRPLPLPLGALIDDDLQNASEPQNLDDMVSSSDISLQKFAGVRSKLGIAPVAPDCLYLTKTLLRGGGGSS